MNAVTGEPDGVQSPARRRPAVEREEFKRTFVLYSNQRSGSNLFKSTMVEVGGLFASKEVFLREGQSGVCNLTFDEYLADPKRRSAELTGQAHELIPDYLREFLLQTPQKKPVLIDLKYPQAFRLGVDDVFHSPNILKVLGRLRVPIIHLVRRDVLSQAISYIVAVRTGTWVDFGHAARVPDTGVKFWLDPAEVTQVARAREFSVRTARYHLEFLKVRHITVFYEDIAGPAWATQYRRVLRFLDLYAEVPETHRPKTVPQRSTRRVANLTEVLEYVQKAAPELVYSYS